MVHLYIRIKVGIAWGFLLLRTELLCSTNCMD